MATENLYPDGVIFSLTNLSGANTDVDESPDSPDANWLTAPGTNINQSAEMSFSTPSGSLTTGSNTQTFRVWVRNTGQASSPTLDIELWESGALVVSLLAAQTVTSNTGQMFTATWNPSAIADGSGANVEINLIGTKGGGSPGTRAAIEVGAVEWQVTYDSGPAPVVITPAAGSITITSVAPTITQQFYRVPSASTLAITSAQPTITQQFYRVPSAGSLVFTGAQPSLSEHHVVTPSAGSLALTGNIPTAIINVPSTVITPNAGSVLITSNAPTLSETTGTPVIWTIEVPASSLTFTGSIPTISISALSVITPAAGSLSITSNIPTTISAIKSIRLNGSGDSIKLTTNLPSENSFTMAGWFKVENDRAGFNRAVLELSNGTSAHRTVLWTTSNSFFVHDGIAAPIFPSNPPINGTWFYVYLKNNGTIYEGGWRKLNDGEWVEVSYTDPNNFTPNAAFWGTDSSDDWMDGDVVYPRIWGAELTRDELIKEMFSRTAVRSANLISASSYDGIDTSGGGNDLILTGTVLGADAPNIQDYALATITTGSVVITGNIPTAVISTPGSSIVTPTAGSLTLSGAIPTSISYYRVEAIAYGQNTKIAVGDDFSITIPSGDDHLALYVGIGVDIAGDPGNVAISYDGSALTLLASSNQTSEWGALYRLIAPNTGTANIVATWNTGTYHNISWVVLKHVNPNDPETVPVVANGGTSSQTIYVTGGSNTDYPLAYIVINNQPSESNVHANDASMQILASNGTGGSGNWGVLATSSDKDGNTTFSWYWDNTPQYNQLLGINVNVFSGGLVITSSGTINITGNIPTAVVPGINTIVVPASSLSITGTLPTVSITAETITITPAAGLLGISGQIPATDISTGFDVPWSIYVGSGSVTIISKIPTAIVSTAGTTIVAPAAGTLNISGSIPAIGENHIAYPTVGSIAFTGKQPSVGENHIVFPTVGSIVISGQIPVIGENHIVNPSVGSIVITSAQPVIGENHIVNPAVGSITITGYAPEKAGSFTATPAAAALVITSNIPSVGENHVVNTNAGIITFNVNQPVIGENHVVNPVNGTITINSSQPSLGEVHVVYPSVRSVLITGRIPSLVYQGSLAVDNGTVTITGHVPSALIPIILPVGAGSIIITGKTSVVGRNYVASTSTGSIVISGKVAIIGLNRVITPTAGSVLITGIAPNLATQAGLVIPSGTITIIGHAPIIGENHVVTPAAGTAFITRKEPFLASAGRLTVQNGTITINRKIPTPTVQFRISVGSGSIVVTSSIPVLGENHVVTPAASSLVATGQVPISNSTLNKYVTTPKGVITITGRIPVASATANKYVSPTVSTVTIIGNVPTVQISASVEVPAGSITITRNIPISVRTEHQYITVGKRTLRIATNFPISGATDDHFAQPGSRVLNFNSAEFELPLTAQGLITLGRVGEYFEGSLPYKLSDYYRGAGLVPDIAQNVNIPTSGQIRLSDFYGAIKA